MASQLKHSAIFVRGLALQAEVGVHHHERGHAQPLVLDVELSVRLGEADRLAETFNYEIVRREALRLAESGHFELVETFARRLGESLIEDERVLSVRIRIEKPLALAPDAQAAGVELVLERA